MSLEPITRMEAILAGEDITPVTRMEYFTKEAVDNAGSGGGGGGGEKFTVTLTEDTEAHTWSADKSVEDCIAAYESGKRVVCLYPLMESHIELPCYYADSHYGAIVFAKTVKTDGEYLYSVSGLKEGSSDEWDASETALGGSSKFVVTLTAVDSGGETVYTADKTIAEIIAADAAGQVVECEYGATHVPLLTAEREGSFLRCDFVSTLFADDIVTTLYISGRNEGHEGDEDEWQMLEAGAEIPSNLKPTYSFAFTVTTDQSDPTQYVCTPASGVTYAAITAALADTDNVYANVALDEQEFILPFGIINNASGSEFVAAAGIAWLGTKFMGCYLRVANDNTPTFEIHDT